MISHAHRIEIAPHHADAGQIVTAQSYLIDRFAPSCEILTLPSKMVAGGMLHWTRGPMLAEPPTPPRQIGRLKRALQGRLRACDGLIVDLRLREPQNFAHFLNNHLPIVFCLAEASNTDWAQLRLLLPGNTPDYILAAAKLFGLATLTTDDRVEGEVISFSMEPWTAVRSVRADWVRRPAIQAAIARSATDYPLPRRVFLARRKTRAIANAAEITEFLEARGFKTVYPEDLTVADQMRLIHTAHEIVAIHGAALAPLLYLPSDAPLKRLIEIMPCGHMTDVYRVMAGQVGTDWIGVRGKIKPEYIRPAYSIDRRFDMFSLDSFEVDPVALEEAFNMTPHLAEGVLGN